MRFEIIAVMLLSIASTSAFSQSAGKKKRRPPASMNQPQTEIGETPTSTQNGGSVAVDTTNANDASKQPTPWPIKVPSWMFTLGLESTPGIPYEKSNSGTQVEIANLKASIKLPVGTSTTEIKSTYQNGTLTLRHDSLIASRRIYVGIAMENDRNRTTTESKEFSIKKTINNDAPNARVSVAFQGRQGLWIGLGSKWTKNFSKSEETGSSTTKTSSHYEETSQFVGIEYMGYPGHAGIEYELKTESKKLTSTTSVPIRLAMSDALFLDLALKTTQSDDVSDGSKSRDLSYSIGLGQQFTASAYCVQVILESDKSWDATQYQNSRAVTYILSGTFGAIKGIRYGAGLGQYNSRSISTDKSEMTISGPVAMLNVRYVQ